MNNYQIVCPHCTKPFQLESAITTQLEANIRKQLEGKLTENAQKLAEARAKLEKEREEFQKSKMDEEALIADKVKEKVELEKSQLTKSIQEKFSEQLDALKKENVEGRNENRELRKREVELLQKEQKMKDMEEDMKIEMERQMLAKRQEIADEVIKREKTKYDFHIKELEKKLEDQKKLATEMQRKAEQGSEQLQGEVLELAIEKFLRENFSSDDLTEVKKGERGADYIHTVKNEFNRISGKIIIECKRTKNFMNSWIEKLRNDQKEAGCDIALLITETMPADMPTVGMRDGVWICSYSDFKPLLFALRFAILREYNIRQSEENKGDKMNMLYKYLTSAEFRVCIENVVQGFSDMRSALSREKNAMAKLHKEREKQIDKVLGSTIDMYGSITGIAGTAEIPSIKLLELGETSTNSDSEQ
jgi:hypothetical protein